MNPLISVIIPAYNCEKTIAIAINSILNQTVLPFEIVIVDDGSKNKIDKKKINKYKKVFKNITLFYQKHLGPSSARNLGLKKASGNLITFFDVDDEMLENYVKKKINYIKKNTKKIGSMIGVHSHSIRNNVKINFLKTIPSKQNVDLIGKFQNGICSSLNNYVLIKKNVKNLGGLDKNLSINEDFDFFIRALQNNYKIHSIKDFDVKVNLTANSLTRNTKVQERYLEQKKFLKKAKSNNYFSLLEQSKREKNLEKQAIRECLTTKLNINCCAKHLIRYLKYLLNI
jgi:glycosyltransferase involved in cell wall biosynthesis